MGVKEVPGQRWIVEKDENTTAIDDWKRALDQLVRISDYLAEHYPETKGRNIDEAVIEILELHRKSEFYRGPASSGVEVVEPEESVEKLAGYVNVNEAMNAVGSRADEVRAAISEILEMGRTVVDSAPGLRLMVILGEEYLRQAKAVEIRKAKTREVEAEVGRHRKQIEATIANSIAGFMRSAGASPKKEG